MLFSTVQNGRKKVQEISANIWSVGLTEKEVRDKINNIRLSGLPNTFRTANILRKGDTYDTGTR